MDGSKTARRRQSSPLRTLLVTVAVVLVAAGILLLAELPFVLS
jgi:flagellin-like protein